MKTLLLLSVVLAAMGVPLAAARARDARRGARWMVVALLVFNVLYVLYVTQIHTVAFVPKWE